MPFWKLLMQTTMSAMFGPTIDCARCHDHKFDPIPPARLLRALQADLFYPAFNVREWVQPKDRWMYGARGKPSRRLAQQRGCPRISGQSPELRIAHQNWDRRLIGLLGMLRWSDDFSATSLKEAWSATAPGGMFCQPSMAITKLDAIDAPRCGRSSTGRLVALRSPFRRQPLVVDAAAVRLDARGDRRLDSSVVRSR